MDVLGLLDKKEEEVFTSEVVRQKCKHRKLYVQANLALAFTCTLPEFAGTACAACFIGNTLNL